MSTTEDPAVPPALDSFEQAGWSIHGCGDTWTAVRVRGPQTRIIAAVSPLQLLERLIAAEDAELPHDDPPPDPAQPACDATLHERTST